MNPHRSRFRFGIRSLLVTVFVVAIFSAFPWLLYLAGWYVWVTGPLLGCFAFIIVRSMDRRESQDFGWPTTTNWFVLTLSLVLLLLGWFARHRWVYAFDDPKWPRPFPYPDEFLIAAHDWLNQLNPVFAGKIKFEGDYYTVLLIMNVIVMIAFILFGAIAGYVFRNGGLVAAWRSVVQRSSP